MRLYAATLAAAATAAIVVPVVISRPIPAGATTHRASTYAKDVAPILQRKCQECHQPGSIAPMSLLNYDDAVAAADQIKDKVTLWLLSLWLFVFLVGFLV